MTATRLIARPLLASTFVVGGVNALKNAPALAIKAKPVVDRIRPTLEKAAPQLKIPDDTVTLVRINAAAQILAAAIALARGRAPRLSSTVLAASLLPTTAGRPPVLERDRPRGEGQPADPLLQEPLDARRPAARRRRHRGSPGVAWRAKHAATGARREAQAPASSEAKLEARLAAKSLGQ